MPLSGWMKDLQDVSQAVPSDYRARAALTKRLRTRARILDALLNCYPGRNPTDVTIVDDVITRAEISRATFYKHFDSLDQAISVLSAQLSEEMIGAYGEIYWPIEDAALRVATGVELFLCRSIIEPGWGAFVSHLDRLSRDHALIRQMRIDLAAGATGGIFDIDDIDSITDLVIGAKSQAIKQIITKTLPVDYVINVTTDILAALGIKRAYGRDVAKSALSTLERDGPKVLTWWRPLR